MRAEESRCVPWRASEVAPSGGRRACLRTAPTRSFRGGSPRAIATYAPQPIWSPFNVLLSSVECGRCLAIGWLPDPIPDPCLTRRSNEVR